MLSEKNGDATLEKKEHVKTRVTHQAGLTGEIAYDSNARRQQGGPEAKGDFLGYIFGTGSLQLRRPKRIISMNADLGAKYFIDTSAEDTIIGRLALRHTGVLGNNLIGGFDAFIKDKVQRGDPWEDVADDPYLSCRPPDNGSSGYRCNRRDYRQGGIAGRLEYPSGSDAFSGRAGLSFLDYKPNRQFSYFGPDTSISRNISIGNRNSLRLYGGGSYRYYHPESVTYRFIPSAGGTIVVQEVQEPRREMVLTGGASWRYSGPFLITGGIIFSSGHNNSDGMDVMRARAEMNAAMRIKDRTTLVISGAYQVAHYPDGNVFRKVAMLADEDERQNFAAMQISHRLRPGTSLVFKASAFSNEIGDAMPFRRHLFHGGIRWSM